jgi:hypothetical protein
MAVQKQVARPDTVEIVPQVARMTESSESDPEERRNLLHK